MTKNISRRKQQVKLKDKCINANMAKITPKKKTNHPKLWNKPEKNFL